MKATTLSDTSNTRSTMHVECYSQIISSDRRSLEVENLPWNTHTEHSLWWRANLHQAYKSCYYSQHSKFRQGSSSEEVLDGLARLDIGYSSIYTVALLYITSLALVPQPNTEKPGIWFWRDVSRCSRKHYSLHSKSGVGTSSIFIWKITRILRSQIQLVWITYIRAS